jgi:hypothetical protein
MRQTVPPAAGTAALPELRDILFVAAVYDRRHFPVLTERRYKFFTPTGDIVPG